VFYLLHFTMDARVKPGHDTEFVAALANTALAPHRNAA
jgi:hypothetical protein